MVLATPPRQAAEFSFMPIMIRIRRRFRDIQNYKLQCSFLDMCLDNRSCNLPDSLICIHRHIHMYIDLGTPSSSRFDTSNRICLDIRRHSHCHMLVRIHLNIVDRSYWHIVVYM